MDKISQKFYLEDFRKRINFARGNLKITTEQVCGALDITRQSLHNFESERVEFKLVNALALSTLFDYTMKKDGIELEEAADFAIARIDYADFILSESPNPQVHSLSYAWQRKLDLYSTYASKELFIEDCLAEHILFIDIFSFTNQEFYERFLLWINRICDYRLTKKIEIYMDGDISEPEKISVESLLPSILNAISEVKQQGRISLYALNISGKDFLEGVHSAIESQGYDFEKCAVMSANPAVLSACRKEKAVVLSVDGTPLNLTGMDGVLENLVKAEEAKTEIKIASLPNNLLNKLFDA